MLQSAESSFEAAKSISIKSWEGGEEGGPGPARLPPVCTSREDGFLPASSAQGSSGWQVSPLPPSDVRAQPCCHPSMGSLGSFVPCSRQEQSTYCVHGRMPGPERSCQRWKDRLVFPRGGANTGLSRGLAAWQSKGQIPALVTSLAGLSPSSVRWG